MAKLPEEVTETRIPAWERSIEEVKLKWKL